MTETQEAFNDFLEKTEKRGYGTISGTTPTDPSEWKKGIVIEIERQGENKILYLGFYSDKRPLFGRPFVKWGE